MHCQQGHQGKLMVRELGPQTTGLAGTLGYMAPEYISTGRDSIEPDVCSFGIVLVESVFNGGSRKKIYREQIII